MQNTQNGAPQNLQDCLKGSKVALQMRYIAKGIEKTDKPFALLITLTGLIAGIMAATSPTIEILEKDTEFSFSVFFSTVIPFVIAGLLLLRWLDTKGAAAFAAL